MSVSGIFNGTLVLFFICFWSYCLRITGKVGTLPANSVTWNWAVIR